VGKSITWDRSMASRPSTVVWGKTSVSICSVRLAVTTTSGTAVCAIAALLAKDNKEKAGVESANAKRRARKVRFFMRNKQVKRPHRLPRQCMGFTTRLATGHLVGRYPGWQRRPSPPSRLPVSGRPVV
jgi:hypothetical protein